MPEGICAEYYILTLLYSFFGKKITIYIILMYIIYIIMNCLQINVFIWIGLRVFVSYI